ncbi:hypothetical protein CCR75_000046 [Bremia lactucae]|uniref:Endonuclease/exonuclease/phosphatase family domain-containing protein 1 n=1 Tax=Bremia lactucae TaxID=4779 RepID=A0A976IDB4_BRELC|nr:hypothetical protein CCR75_000046 [Bremia lactucae]
MNLNTATLCDLQQLPGVGCVTARLIVESRPFTSVKDLVRVHGIGPVKFAAISAAKQIYVDDESLENNANTMHQTKAIKVDLNGASKRQLQQLKGVGPILAQRIIDARPFHRNEDVLAVKGISIKSYLRMQGEVFVKDYLNCMRKCDSNDVNSEENFRKKIREAPRGRAIESDVREHLFSTWNHGCVRESALLVASWNIRNISRRKEFHLLQRIANILDEFDVVALQEVRDLIVLKKLKTMLPGWDYIVSATVGPEILGTKRRVERYAFFYRRCAVKLVKKCSLLESRRDAMMRQPCVATFRATQSLHSQKLDITLINVHVSFGNKESRHAEIAEINRLAKAFEASDPIKRVIILGDFNLSPQDLLKSLGKHKKALILAPQSTTVFNKLYDNIWIDRFDITDADGDEEFNYIVDSGVLRIDWRHYPLSKSDHLFIQNPIDAMLPRLQTYMARVQCSYELSDHCPVWIAIAAASKRYIGDG